VALIAAGIPGKEQVFAVRLVADQAHPIVGEGQALGPAAVNGDGPALCDADQVGDEGDTPAIRRERRSIGATNVQEAGVVDLVGHVGGIHRRLSLLLLIAIVAWLECAFPSPVWPSLLIRNGTPAVQLPPALRSKRAQREGRHAQEESDGGVVRGDPTRVLPGNRSRPNERWRPCRFASQMPEYRK